MNRPIEQGGVGMSVICFCNRLKILGVEEDRDLSDLVNEAIGELLGKHEKR